MIDVAICLELPTRAEHPLMWCIVGGVIYDGGTLRFLAGAYCVGRVWHGRPRSEQAGDTQAAWPELCLMGLSLKALNSKLAPADVSQILCNAVQREGGWHGRLWHLTVMNQSVCHLSMRVRGWARMSSWSRCRRETETELRKLKFQPVC